MCYLLHFYYNCAHKPGLWTDWLKTASGWGKDRREPAAGSTAPAYSFPSSDLPSPHLWWRFWGKQSIGTEERNLGVEKVLRLSLCFPVCWDPAPDLPVLPQLRWIFERPSMKLWLLDSAEQRQHMLTSHACHSLLRYLRSGAATERVGWVLPKLLSSSRVHGVMSTRPWVTRVLRAFPTCLPRAKHSLQQSPRFTLSTLARGHMSGLLAFYGRGNRGPWGFRNLPKVIPLTSATAGI